MKSAPGKARGRVICYIGLGSNIGDRMANCRLAVKSLASFHNTEMRTVSSLYETEPVCSEGPWFLNGVVGISTGLDPEDLLARCQQIESKLGRPEVRPAASPRAIDLDILLYGEQVFNTPTFQIPHPRMHERAFVLIPMAEIAPNARHPLFKKTITELRNQLKDSHEVKWFGGREVYCD